MACAAREVSKEDLIRNYYLLGLYAHNRELLLRQLEQISPALGGDNLSSLIKAIRAFLPDECERSNKRKQTSPVMQALTDRLIKQTQKVRQTALEGPHLISLVRRYLELNNQKELDHLSQKCLSTSDHIARVLKENDIIEDELIELNDFLSSCPWFSHVDNLRKALLDANTELLEIQSLYMMLFDLLESSTPYSESLFSGNRIIAEYFRKMGTVYLSANDVVTKVSIAIQAQDPHAEEPEESFLEEQYGESLEDALNQCQTMVKDINNTLDAKGEIAEKLMSCDERLEALTCTALCQSLGYLQALLDKIKMTQEVLSGSTLQSFCYGQMI